MSQLDAEKSFDLLWRDGLFYKLHDSDKELTQEILSIVFWRALLEYYSVSKFMIKYDNQKSDENIANDSIKQGGILSGYLFNFMMNKLIINDYEKTKEVNLFWFYQKVLPRANSFNLLTKSPVKSILKKEF